MEKMVQQLTEELIDPDSGIRVEAAWSLGTLGPEAAAAVPALTQTLRDADWYARADAASALGKIGSAAAPSVSSLIRSLKDPDRHVRACAAWAIGKIGSNDKAVITALRAAEGAELDEDTRQTIAEAIRVLRDSR